MDFQILDNDIQSISIFNRRAKIELMREDPGYKLINLYSKNKQIFDDVVKSDDKKYG